jgi:hypothetical protein
MAIDRIISGGQTGSDIAGLIAALACGIPTGGYAPRGWLTEAGPAPWLGRDYGLVECPEPSWERPTGMPEWQWNAICYSERTKRNAQKADVTLWFDFRGRGDSRGYHVTLQNARSFIGITKDDPRLLSSTPMGLATNFSGSIHGTINIAGNRESKSRGIGEWVERYLRELFRLIAERDNLNVERFGGGP